MLSALEVRERAAVLSGVDPAATLAWAVETFPAKVALTVSFGGGGVVLAHLISRIDRSVPVIFLDTRFHFRENAVPYHPLLDQGYSSIGCWPCTRPTASGEAERAGRWSGSGKTECGLHTFTRKT